MPEERDSAVESTVAAGLESTAASDPGARPVGPANPAQIGRYRVEKLLGQGAMGAVYLATDPDLERRVAIKVLHDQSGAWGSRLLREGQAIAKLRHPNVITVFDVGSHEAGVFIAMEYMPGGTLTSWLKAEPRSWRAIAARFSEAGRGLVAAHAAGLTHRDFKPDNVLVDGDGHAVVSDFGLVHVDGSRARSDREASMDMTRSGTLLGTPAYMSPEQLRGEPADARSDQFSFCVACWEALFGVRPFDPDGRPPQTLKELMERVIEGAIQMPPRTARVPARIGRALRRGLSVDPDDRFPSVSALLSTMEPRRWSAIAGVTAALAIVPAGLFLAWGGGGSSPGLPPPPSCDRASAPIDELWNPTRRAQYLAGSGDAAYAADDVRWFDAFVEDWRAAATRACEQPEDRVAVCLAAARDAFETAVTRDRSTWPRLPTPSACADEEPRLVSRDLLGGFGNVSLSAVFSPDGAELAFATTDGNRGILDVATGVDRTGALPAMFRVLAWPSDDRLLAQTASLDVVAVDLAGSKVVPILSRPGLESVSPDGELAIAIAGDHARLIRVRSGEVILEQRAKDIGGVAWEPGTSRVAIVAALDPSIDRWGLAVLDPAAGTSSRTWLRILGTYVVPAPTWSAPGEILVAGRDGAFETDGVWRLTIGTDGASRGWPRRVHDSPAGTVSHVLAARENRVVLQTIVAEPRLYRLASGSPSRLPGGASLRQQVVDSAVQAGAVLLTGPTNVRIADAQGATLLSAPRRPDETYGLHGDRLVIARPSPDRTRTQVVERDASGAEHVRFTLAGGDPALMRCNPWNQDRCVVIRPATRGFDVAMVEGDTLAAPISVGPAASSAQLSADGTRLLWVEDEELVIFSVSTRETERFREPGFTIRGASWGRDDRVVEFRGANDDPEAARFQLRSWTIGATTSSLLHDNDDVFISGHAPIGNGELLFSALELPAKLSLLEPAE